MEFPDLNTSSDNSSWKKLKEKTHNEPFPYDRFICQKAIYNDLIEFQKHLLEGFDVDYFDDSIQIYATVNVKTIKEKSSDKKTEVDEKPLGEPTIEEPSVKVETLVEEPVIENLQEEKASIEDLQVEQPQSSNDIPNTTSKKRNPNDDLKLE